MPRMQPQLRARQRSGAQGCGGWRVTGGLVEVGICNRLGPSLLSVPGLSPFPGGGQLGLWRWPAAACRRAAWPGAAVMRAANAVCSYWKLDCEGAGILFLWKCPGTANEGREKQKTR